MSHDTEPLRSPISNPEGHTGVEATNVGLYKRHCGKTAQQIRTFTSNF